VTAIQSRQAVTARPNTLGTQVVRVLTTTDHKVIGKLYLVTAFCWFLVAGLMAMLIRSELAFVYLLFLGAILAFGAGQHVCPGKALTLLFLGEVMQALIDVPHLSLAPGTVSWQPGLMPVPGEIPVMTWRNGHVRNR